MITVRPVESSDIEPLTRDVKDAEAFHASRLELQRRQRAIFLVALDDDSPVAYGLLKLPPLGNEHPRAPDIPEIEDLFVSPARRSRGVGTRLLLELETEARSRGFDRVGLAVGIENAGARRLYESHGFRDAGLGSFWIEGADETCVYLVKDVP